MESRITDFCLALGGCAILVVLITKGWMDLISYF